MSTYDVSIIDEKHASHDNIDTSGSGIDLLEARQGGALEMTRVEEMRIKRKIDLAIIP